MIFYLITPLILIIGSSLGLLISPSWSISPFIWVFILVPIIDIMLPYLNKKDQELNENLLHNFSIIIILPCILFLIIFGLVVVSDISISVFAVAALGAAVGMSGGSIGITTAHELIHRQSYFMRSLGVILLILCLYGHFRIEHVYGHHKDVCLKKDSATAQRGQSIYHFIISSSLGQFITAYKIEIRRNKPIYQNRLLQSTIRSVIFIFIMFMIGGVYGLVIALAIALVAKILLETVNYIEHYGLVRKEGQRVYPRHSWNSNHLMSNIMLYNLSRHSHHHEKAYLEFWELKPYDDAPEMPYGYLSMIYIALLFPWWYHRIMAKKLIDWDACYANDDEKEIARQDNQNSGLKVLAGGS